MDNLTNSRRTHLRLPVFSEAVVFLLIFCGSFGTLAHIMGPVHFIHTLMATAYRLLMDTVFDLMAILVLTGALSALLVEFGVVALLNRLMAPVMMPLFRMPGASAMGPVTTYLSDNPAVMTLAEDPKFRSCFQPEQLAALSNLSTSFGMGLVVSAFMLALKPGMSLAVLAGNLGAVVGAVCATRLMLRSLRKHPTHFHTAVSDAPPAQAAAPKGHLGERILSALLRGGRNGVDMGLSMIPGVLIICSLVMLLTGTPGPDSSYTGAAFEGVPLLLWLGQKLSGILCPLFGFSSPQVLAVPVTAMGSAGAAISLVPQLLEQGLAGGVDVAVITAMCMCFSGYLSTQSTVMTRLGLSHLAGRAMAFQTVGGITAGIAAHLLYELLTHLPV